MSCWLCSACEGLAGVCLHVLLYHGKVGLIDVKLVGQLGLLRFIGHVQEFVSPCCFECA